MQKTMFYIFLFIFGFIAVSLWSFWLVIRPPKIQINQTPRDFNLPAEDVTVTTEDGVTLSAWFVRQHGDTSRENRAVIFLHGYPAEKSDMLAIAAPLSLDFSLLFLDMRYFGKSGGGYTTLGIKEWRDLKAAVDFLMTRGIERIGVFGFSLGGATGLMSAAEDPRIRAVATYAAFSDLVTLGRESYSGLLVFKYPLVSLMLLWSRLLFGESVADISPLIAARKLSIPVLLIHSPEDEQISFGHAERLKMALANNPRAEFYFLEKGRHGELPLDFSLRLKDFFAQSL